MIALKKILWVEYTGFIYIERCEKNNCSKLQHYYSFHVEDLEIIWTNEWSFFRPNLLPICSAVQNIFNNNCIMKQNYSDKSISI